MLDMKFVRENPDAVKENIKKKFQDAKLPLVDEVIALDAQRRANIQEADQLRADLQNLARGIQLRSVQAQDMPRIRQTQRPRLIRQSGQRNSADLRRHIGANSHHFSGQRINQAKRLVSQIVVLLAKQRFFKFSQRRRVL